MEIQQIIILSIIGLFAGILSGLMGLGGAIIIIPALVIFIGYSQQMAQGTALLMMVLPVGALAAWQYYQKGFVDFKAAGILALFFFAGGYIGARYAVKIPEVYLKKAFALLLVLIAVRIFFYEKS